MYQNSFLNEIQYIYIYIFFLKRFFLINTCLNLFKVGDLQDMTIVSSQSMDKQEIPTIGSILPKRENHKLPQPEECKVPGG